jgi:23S rRNA (uracil1939-C5)-methyltransferase
MGDKMKEIKKKNFNRVKPSASSGNRALKEDYSKFRKMDFDQYEKYEMNKMDKESKDEAGFVKEQRGEQRKKGQQQKDYQSEARSNGQQRKEQQGKEQQGKEQQGKKQQGKEERGKAQDRYKKSDSKLATKHEYKQTSLSRKSEAGMGKKRVSEVTPGKTKRLDDLSDYEDFTPEQKRTMDQERRGKSGDRRRSGEKPYKDDLARKGKESKQDGRKEKTACPYLRDCGGCNILQKSYETELKGKQKMVEDLIKSFCKVEPIIGMKNPKHYRNKVHVVFDHDRKGNPISGVYEEGTHRVIAIDKCLIHNQKADEIIASIRGMLKSFKIKTYDEDTGYGLLRHVMVRTGFTSGEIMVVLVLASPIMPSKNNFVKALRKQHPEITTVVLNVNDKDTSMVLGEKEQVIYGKGYIEDSLCGKVFRISSKSFYQVNPVQTEVLYGKAIEFAGLTGTETVVDAYCGIGTIGIIAADKAKKVIGVELNKDAVKDAVINAKRNNAGNIAFYQNDASDFMVQMAQQGEKVDVVFMDPPRAGSTEKFMDAVAVLQPSKVVYVSCNPVTLERDLKYFKKKGYQAQRAVPVDMFAWTSHVETVVLLERKAQ